MGLGVIKATFLLRLLYCNLCHFFKLKKAEGRIIREWVLLGGPWRPLELSPSFILFFL